MEFVFVLCIVLYLAVNKQIKDKIFFYLIAEHFGSII